MVDCFQQLYCHQEVGAHLSSHATNCPNSLTEQPSRILLSAGATLGNHAASYHLQQGCTCMLQSLNSTVNPGHSCSQLYKPQRCTPVNDPQGQQ